jgi:hypothetical protein
LQGIDMNDDNVTPLPCAAALPENPLAFAPRTHLDWCRHEAVLIDVHTRSIRCAEVKCGAVLDPFDFLVSNARTVSSAWSNYHEMQRRVSELAERVHELKKEEQRLRAMVKRLQDKTGAVMSMRGKE